jgi:predicted lipid carrier protein YhbT
MRRIQAALVRFIARRVRAAKRERLERMMRGPRRRRLVLWTIFGVMPRVVRRRALEREKAVIEWRISGRGDGRHDVRQLVIEAGSAIVLAGEPREPDLTVILDGTDLLLLATGNSSAPAMFVRGDVEIDGDPWLALRLPRIFGLGGGGRR